MIGQAPAAKGFTIALSAIPPLTYWAQRQLHAAPVPSMPDLPFSAPSPQTHQGFPIFFRIREAGHPPRGGLDAPRALRRRDGRPTSDHKYAVSHCELRRDSSSRLHPILPYVALSQWHSGKLLVPYSFVSRRTLQYDQARGVPAMGEVPEVDHIPVPLPRPQEDGESIGEQL